MTTKPTIAILFQTTPVQWGLRGDPYLWQAMQAKFSQTPLPDSQAQLVQQIETLFTTLTGHPISTSNPFYVAGFSHGGMSSGYISPKFWQETAVPLLCRHFTELTSSTRTRGD